MLLSRLQFVSVNKYSGKRSILAILYVVVLVMQWLGVGLVIERSQVRFPRYQVN